MTHCRSHLFPCLGRCDTHAGPASSGSSFVYFHDSGGTAADGPFGAQPVNATPIPAPVTNAAEAARTSRREMGELLLSCDFMGTSGPRPTVTVA